MNELLQRAFGEGSERAIAEALLEYLENHSTTSHINLQLMRQLAPGANTGALDREIVKTLNFLAGDVRVLDIRFELFDESLEHAQDLSAEEARGALREKVNPITGQDDPSIAKKIGIYFSPLAQIERHPIQGKKT